MNKEQSESGIRYDSTPYSSITPPAGDYPFRSGIHQNMYKSRPWTIRQYAGFGNPQEANQRLKTLIEAGATGISIAFDLPTQMGLDPDDELASAEVGKVGVSISCLDDMRQLLDGIDISKVSTSMTINATAPILLLMYQIVAEERGIDLDQLQGTIQNDVLKEFISRGTYVFSAAKSLQLAVETIIYCKNYLPRWNSISLSGYHMSEAGATAVQEIAFTFANAIEYLNALSKKGISIDEVAPRISFFFASRMTFLEDIAKFRAAREVWAKIMKEKFQSVNPKSLQLRFHSQTAGVQLIAQNPELNVVRVALQSLGALFGGTQSLHTNAYDEALALPSYDAAKLALQTQQVIMEETDLTFAVDPFRGSYLIENMTDQIVLSIESELRNIASLGGALKCIQNGYQIEKIETNAFQIARAIEDGTKRIIGLNYSLDSETQVKNFTPVTSKKSSFEIRGRNVRESRDSHSVESSLKSLAESAEQNNYVIPLIKNCILSGATIGEICSALSDAWGNER